MTETRGIQWPTLVLTLWLLIPAGTGASPMVGSRPLPDYPPSSYSPWHYWAPTLYKLHQRLHGPEVGPHSLDSYPPGTSGFPAGPPASPAGNHAAPPRPSPEDSGNPNQKS
jgi:hypothetical protein